MEHQGMDDNVILGHNAGQGSAWSHQVSLLHYYLRNVPTFTPKLHLALSASLLTTNQFSLWLLQTS